MTKLNVVASTELNGIAYNMYIRVCHHTLHFEIIKTPKTMSKSCFRGKDTDGKKGESSYLLFVA